MMPWRILLLRKIVILNWFRERLFNMPIKISGVVGTFYNKSKNKWEAHIKVNYKKHRLGYFDGLKEAIIARYKAEQEYNMVKKDHIFGAYQWLRDKKLLDENDNVME